MEKVQSSKEQMERLFSQLHVIRSKDAYSFELEKSLAANMVQVQEIKQVSSIVAKELPDSTAKGALLKFLELETNYYQQVTKLSQERVVMEQELSSTIFGPDGQRIIPYVPLPFSKMQLVGWDEDGNEVYYNTDDGYYYVRDSPGGNTFTRFSNKYMDADSKMHNAGAESKNCGWWQWVYRFFGSEKLTFPSVFINNLDKETKGKLRPDSDWFNLP